MSSHQWKRDVFVSFRGKDVRKNFISHLFRELDRAGIDCFSDEDPQDTGEYINDKLLGAIRHARFALIVFTRNYADSKSCLNELVEILDCRRQLKNDGHVVVSIFHGVSTDDVSKLTSGSEFAQGFERLCEIKRDDAQIKKWRDALEEATHLSGLHLENHAHGNEAKLTEMIVHYLSEKIRQTQPLYFVNNAIGVDHLANDVISLLKKGCKEDVRMIGICGTEQIGKTTVAVVACDGICGEFECSVFLGEIGEANRSDLLGLQKKLLQNLVKEERVKMYDIHTNINEIKRKMRCKKILLVLDNVTNKEQMKHFGAGDRESFCPGSRILITTRDRDLLKDLKVDDKYIVNGLNPDHALQLFCHYAFKRSEPKQGYEALSQSLFHYAGGHPSALKRLGSFLSDKSKDKWHEILDKLVRSPYLDCIDGSLPLKSDGPHGGQRGGAYDDKTYIGVRQISVLVDKVINSITIDYDQDGCLVRSSEHGGHLCGDLFTVKLDYPNEHLTSISGHIRNYRIPTFIQSLKFDTNNRTYGPFGFEQGQFFRSQVDGRRIIGFHGNCGAYLDSIGAHFGPISHAFPFEVVGPFGGDYGTNIWDDGKHTDVREILVGFDSTINFISVLYDKHGRPVGPFTHGTNGGGKTYRIKLDYPSEYLTSISGYIGEVSGLTILRSLTIHTNEKCYIPFGTAEGRYFSFPYTGGKIVGFHGSCDSTHLGSIGAYYEPIPHTHPSKVFGPFGGDSGDPWDDGRYIDIKRIVVRYDRSFIHSIAFDYVDDNGSIRSIRHGGIGGEKTFEVELVPADEYITSFAGYLENAKDKGTLINSLTFQTNKRILGPIGREEGAYFSLPSEAGKIIGFLGTSGDYLESIGAQAELRSNKLYPFKSVGLFGRSNASLWDDGNTHTNVRKIIVEFEPSKGPCIQSIAFQYEEQNRELWQSDTHGGINGNEFHIIRNVHTIKIDAVDEYLTSISAYFHLGGITSLTFQTNKKTIGPIGEEKGWHFSSPATGGKIVGFYGRSDKHLEAIGAHFEPISYLYPVKSIGPFGGLGGHAWYDGKFNGVIEVQVMHDDVIRHIMFVYDKSGEEVRSNRHGGHDKDARITRVRLDYPREYLTSISGYKRDDGQKNINNAIIQSLTFHSNRRRIGPFGKETGNYFWYPATGSKIIGFYGTCGKTLNSIGVYAEPIPHLYPFKTVGAFGGSGGTPWDDGVHTDVEGILCDCQQHHSLNQDCVR
ncbi:jacalin-related lectin 4 [Eucalyptus grandis]|uniref:jacalin-related lectin 4 n=1 Tax=Eucalyptus grandis TaxID=71139 RepID=UPI00192F0DB6|nr:jacalin-related lectin 4 [Eucalyptus grandis]